MIIGDVEVVVIKIKDDLNEARNMMHRFLEMPGYGVKENEVKNALKYAQKINMPCFKKTMINWLRCGDENSKVCYQAIKTRRAQKNLHAIPNTTGAFVNNMEDVEVVFLDFYKNLVACKD